MQISPGRFISRRTFMIGAWTGVIALMLVLYWNSTSTRLERHDEILSAIRSIKDQDALLNQSLLKSRSYLEKTYDPMNDAIARIHTATDFLRKPETGVYKSGDSDFDRAFEDYEIFFGTRKKLIDRFKSGNSVLKNSLYYFPRSVRRVNRITGGRTTVILNDLSQEILAYNVTGEDDVRASMQKKIDQLRGLAANSADDRREILVLVRHAVNILERKSDVDGLLNQAILGPGSRLNDNLFDAYEARHTRELYRTNIFRLLLFAFSVGLLMYVGLVFLKLRLAGVSLRNANTRLERLNSAFERFVPVEFLQYLNRKSIADVRLGQFARSHMTVLFSDIRNFTSISERMTPEENFAFINSYLREMGPIIRRHEGFIDKYIGDAIMALFKGSGNRGVMAGVLMLKRLEVFNAERAAAGEDPIRVGIGLHTGDMMLGTVGEDERMQGTVISDAVNLAARLESLTKEYEVSLLISEETLSEMQGHGDFETRFIDRVAVKGKQIPVRVYEVFDADPPKARLLKQRTAPLLSEAFALYSQEKDYRAAIQKLDEALEEFPDDRALHIHRDRCQAALATNE
ncbi:MAG: hypothetical protein NXI24_05225 [bacterium]|nr:hypothetical protein [bacterium]